MATLAEIAAIRRKLPQGESANNSGPLVEYSAPGLTIQPDLPPLFTPPAFATGLNAPPQAFATDADVNAAYQALMRYSGEADQVRGTMRRQFDEGKTRAQNDRAKSILMANQGMADRGILNSGIAQGRKSEIDTQWDQYDTGLTDQYNANLGTVENNILSLGDAYQNAQVGASARLTQEASAARDAAQQEQLRAEQQNQLMAELLAMLSPELNPEMAAAAAAPAVPANPMYNPYAQAAAKPKVPVRKPVSGETGYLTQSRLSGPQ